jgi:O-antigen/teichoic acid export membrane protein
MTSARPPVASSVGAIAVVASGGIAGQLVFVGATTVLTGLYLPADYAWWAVLVALTTLVGGVSGLRYESAIVIVPTRAEAANLYWMCLGLSVACAGAVFGVLTIAGPGAEKGPGVLALLHNHRTAVFVLVVTTGMYQAGAAWCNRESRFGALALASAANVTFTVLAQIGLAVAGHGGTTGLVAGSVTGQLATAALLGAVVLLPEGRPALRTVSLGLMRRLAAAHRGFPLYMVPYAIVGGLRDRVTLLLFSVMAPAAQVGLYAFAHRLASVPLGLAGSAIRPVVFRRAAADAPDEVERLVSGLLDLLQRCLIPFAVVLAWRAADVFGLAFDEGWAGGHVYLLLLSAPTFVMLHTVWMDRLLDIAGRQRHAFLLELTYSAAALATVFLTLRTFGSLIVAVAALSAVGVLHNVCWLVIVFRIWSFPVARLRSLALSAAGLGVAWLTLLLVLERAAGDAGTVVFLVAAGVYVVLCLRAALTTGPGPATADVPSVHGYVSPR